MCQGSIKAYFCEVLSGSHIEPFAFSMLIFFEGFSYKEIYPGLIVGSVRWL